MIPLRLFRPSPAMVVACVALGVALSGGASATTLSAATAGGTSPQAQVFTASGTYQVPVGVSEVEVRLWGGGGGGGGTVFWSSDSAFDGGPGGYVDALVPVAGVPQLAVTVGAGAFGGAPYNGTGFSGGASSVADGAGTLASAAGGGGGGASSPGSGGSVTVVAPAVGLQVGSASAGEAGAAQIAGAGGAGAPPGYSDSSGGGTGSSGLVEVIPVS